MPRGLASNSCDLSSRFLTHQGEKTTLTFIYFTSALRRAGTRAAVEKPWQRANATCGEAPARLHATRVRRRTRVGRTHVGEDSHGGGLTWGRTHSGEDLRGTACWETLCSSRPSAGLGPCRSPGLWRVGRAIWFLSHGENRAEHPIASVNRRAKNTGAQHVLAKVNRIVVLGLSGLNRGHSPGVAGHAP